jgi:hypothetical protein
MPFVITKFIQLFAAGQMAGFHNYAPPIFFARACMQSRFQDISKCGSANIGEPSHPVILGPEQSLPPLPRLPVFFSRRF